MHKEKKTTRAAAAATTKILSTTCVACAQTVFVQTSNLHTAYILYVRAGWFWFDGTRSFSARSAQWYDTFMPYFFFYSYKQWCTRKIFNEQLGGYEEKRSVCDPQINKTTTATKKKKKLNRFENKINVRNLIALKTK